MNEKVKGGLADGILRGIDSAKKAGEAHVSKWDKADEKLSEDTGGIPVGTPKLPEKLYKPKELVVRYTFSFPTDEYSMIEKQVNRALLHAQSLTRSEIIRVGLKLLADLSEDEFIKAISNIEKVAQGRPRSK